MNNPTQPVAVLKMQYETTWNNITKTEARRIIGGDWPVGKCHRCRDVVFLGEQHTHLIRRERILLCQRCMFIPKPIERKLLPERTI